MASNGARPKLSKTTMTHVDGDRGRRHDRLTTEMDRAGAGVQGLLDSTNAQKEVLDQQLTAAQKELERMKEVERLIEERKQRAKARQEMQAESRRREQEDGDSLDGIGGADNHQGERGVPGMRDDQRPDAPWWPMAHSTPYPFPWSERGRDVPAFGPRAETGLSPRMPPLKMPSIPLPKYKKGDNWEDFLVEFQEVAELLGMSPTQSLLYLKQCVPEEGRLILVTKRVKTLEDAVGILGALYTPTRDAMSLFKELEKVTQKPGERLQVLASRIESVANQYAKVLSSHITRAEVENLICARFRQAIIDEDLKNHLLWDQQVTTLNQMVTKAQQFEDNRAQMTSAPKRGLRTTEEEAELKQLRAKVDELQKTLESVLAGKTNGAKTSEGRGGWSRPHNQSQPRQPRKRYPCWNCGEEGHQRRECPKERIGDGFTYSTWRRPRRPRSEVTSHEGSLN